MYYLFEYLCAKFARCKTDVKLLTIKFCSYAEKLYFCRKIKLDE